MIKITAILVILYFILRFFVKSYVESLGLSHTLRFSVGNHTSFECIILFSLGLIRIAMYISVTITAIYLVFKYL